MSPTVEGLARELIRALRAAAMPCAIGGAIACSVWGVPRGTTDVDINVFVPERRYGELLEVLIAAGCLSRHGQPWTADDRAEWLARARDGWNAVAWKDGFKVCVFVPSIPFYVEAERTVREVDVRGERVPILSAEAISVFKLLFFRDKDLVDLRRLVARQGDALDVAYVRRHIVDMVGEDDDRTRAWDRIVRGE